MSEVEEAEPQGQDEIDGETLQLAMAALFSAGIDQSKAETLLGRMLASREAIKEEVKEEARKEIAEELELEADAGMQATLDGNASKRLIELGNEENGTLIQHPVRILVQYDFERIAGYMPDLIRLLYNRGPSKLQGMAPMEVLQEVLQAVQGIGKEKIKRAFYAELANCLSYSDVPITADFLRHKCLPSQIVRAALAVWEVNQRFFTELWAALPGDTTRTLTSSIGQIIRHTRNLGQMSSALLGDLSGIGTMLNGGLMNLSTLSPLSTDGLPSTSEPWTLPDSGATAMPLADAETAKDTSPGSTLKTPRTTPTPLQLADVAEGGSGA